MKGIFHGKEHETFAIATSLLTVWKVFPKTRHLILIVRQGRRQGRGCRVLPFIKYIPFHGFSLILKHSSILYIVFHVGRDVVEGHSFPHRIKIWLTISISLPYLE
ncbi:hypothetical protein V6Z11_D07G255200 [Gossypium hirsutum]